MLNKDKSGGRDFDFVLEDRHSQRMDLILYLTSVLLIVIVFLLSHFFIEDNIVRTFIVGLFSLSVGFFLLYKRNLYRKRLSDLRSEQKRAKIKTENKRGLKTALGGITPKGSNLKLKIREKISLGEKFAKLKYKFTKNGKKNSKEYIEIED